MGAGLPPELPGDQFILVELLDRPEGEEVEEAVAAVPNLVLNKMDCEADRDTQRQLVPSEPDDRDPYEGEELVRVK